MLDLNQLYHMDCMEGMKRFPDGYFDLAVVDPPYGRGMHGGKNYSKWVRQKSGKALYVRHDGYEDRGWDDEPPGPAYFEELFRVSKHQIIWGVNYLGYPFGPGRIVWDKVNDGSHQSGAEIAYNSRTDRVDLVRYMWRGMLQGRSAREGAVAQGNKEHNEVRIHPTQKPVELYRWIYSRYANPGARILDTHTGSASSLVAAFEMGFDFVGFEIDEAYFGKASERLEMVMAQMSLWR